MQFVYALGGLCTVVRNSKVSVTTYYLVVLGGKFAVYLADLLSDFGLSGFCGLEVQNREDRVEQDVINAADAQ